MKIEIYKGFWNTNITQKNTRKMYLFGDNNIGRGTGRQAVIRHEPNAFGIPTKKLPNNNSNAFYNDDEFDNNKIHIDKAITNIITNSSNYDTIVLPNDGFGTGLAKLSSKAPNTLKYINKMVRKMIDTFETDFSKNVEFLK
jgi:hypothetical protein